MHLCIFHSFYVQLQHLCRPNEAVLSRLYIDIYYSLERHVILIRVWGAGADGGRQ